LQHVMRININHVRQRCNSMSSILDIDLDYFNLVEKPAERLSQMLKWANCPVSFVVENHHESLRRWKSYVRKRKLCEPQFILHVDEHHDMMDERRTPNIVHFIYHAMRIWAQARVHWLVEEPIDSPAMWLSEVTWQALSKRFTMGINIPPKWPKPQLVSICTSPEFVDAQRRNEMITVVEKSINAEQAH